MLHPVVRVCQEIDIAVGCLRGNELSSNLCRTSNMIRPGNGFASARKRSIEWIFWKDFRGTTNGGEWPNRPNPLNSPGKFV